MKKGTLVLISTALFVIGLILLASSLSITGNVVSENIGKTTGSILGLVFIIVGILLFLVRNMKGLEEVVIEEGIDKIAEKNKWREYGLSSVIVKDMTGKTVRMPADKADTMKKYLQNTKKTRAKKLTPVQERIEKIVNRGEVISYYPGPEEMTKIYALRSAYKRKGKARERDVLMDLRRKEGLKGNKELVTNVVKQVNELSQKEQRQKKSTYERLLSGETVNKRTTYEEQFYEGHAARGGRVIEASSHVKDGKLYHFGKPADGSYIWIIDEKGNFVLGDRMKMRHDMVQMKRTKLENKKGKFITKFKFRRRFLPHSTLAKGRRVYGSGEVEIEGGLIKSYNADSGHYADPTGFDKFNEQSGEVFRYFTDKIGWDEVKKGAKFKSKYAKI